MGWNPVKFESMADEMNPDDEFIAIPWTASKEEPPIKKKKEPMDFAPR